MGDSMHLPHPPESSCQEDDTPYVGQRGVDAALRGSPGVSRGSLVHGDPNPGMGNPRPLTQLAWPVGMAEWWAQGPAHSDPDL